MREIIPEKTPSTLAGSPFATGKGVSVFAEDSFSLGEESFTAVKVESALAKVPPLFARALFSFAKVTASPLVKSPSRVFVKAASVLRRDPACHLCLVWAMLFLMATTWSFIIPIKSQADEPVCTIQAATAVRGRFIAEGHLDVHCFNFRYNRHDVGVPRGLKNIGENIACLVFFLEAPEKCAEPVPTGDDKADITPMAMTSYPLLYHMAVG